MRKAYLVWVTGYFLLVTVILLGLIQARSYVRSEMSSPEEIEAWREWQSGAKQKGPVERQAPRTHEPPAVTLMEEHFVIVATASVVMCSVLYGFLALVVQGMLSGQRRE